MFSHLATAQGWASNHHDNVVQGNVCAWLGGGQVRPKNTFLLHPRPLGAWEAADWGLSFSCPLSLWVPLPFLSLGWWWWWWWCESGTQWGIFKFIGILNPTSWVYVWFEEGDGKEDSGILGCPSLPTISVNPTTVLCCQRFYSHFATKEMEAHRC